MITLSEGYCEYFLYELVEMTFAVRSHAHSNVIDNQFAKLLRLHKLFLSSSPVILSASLYLKLYFSFDSRYFHICLHYFVSKK